MRFARRRRGQLIFPDGGQMNIGGQAEVIFSIKEAIVFAVGLLVLGALLTILGFLRPGLLTIIRWLIGLALIVAAVIFSLRWQIQRLRAYEPDTCIKCGQFLDFNEERCVNCGVAAQASLKLDVGSIVAILSTGAILLAGLIVGWKAMWILMGLLCLTALLLFYYNRKEVSLRYGMGIGNILRAGFYGICAIMAVFVVWFVWVLS